MTVAMRRQCNKYGVENSAETEKALYILIEHFRADY